MGVEEALRMNGGCGESSYASNSRLQDMMISMYRGTIRAAVADLCCATNFPGSITIAELGCSSGPNAFSSTWKVFESIHERYSLKGWRFPEVTVFLNDLPGNDFNTVFRMLPSFQQRLSRFEGDDSSRCFFAGVAGSFYGRLFRTNSLEFIHSASSLHWLSRVPPEIDVNPPLNIGKIYISKSSPSCVLNAYLAQFQKDFSAFLRCRSAEVVSGGCMVLSFLGRHTADPTTEESCQQWELLADALNGMVKEGLVEKERVDSFNAPYYSPSMEEVMHVVQEEGSFHLKTVETHEVDWFVQVEDFSGKESNGKTELNAVVGENFAKTIRAVVEPVLEYHFGQEIMEDLFERFQKLVDEYLSVKTGKYINLVISLARKV